MSNLSRKKVQEILQELEDSVDKTECFTCECFQGLLTQLELDSLEDAHDLIERFKIPTEKIHKCLGCDPCPGGDLFADYLRQKKG